MIDLQREELLTLTEASKALPAVDGKRPHISTLWRWCRVGLGGVKLEYVRLGRRICTSRQALGRFAQSLADADAPPSSATRPDDDASVRQAETYLVREGI